MAVSYRKSFKLLVGVTLLILEFSNVCECKKLINVSLIKQYLLDSKHSSDTCVHDVPTATYFDLKNDYFQCFGKTARSGSSRHPDQDLRANALILKYGYNLVTYDNVITKDGYILTVFRISGSPISPPRPGKPAVLLYHGMATASDMWLLQNDFKKNLAIKLVDTGYDVWLVNSRGSDFSQRHIALHSEVDLKYWDFSYHEMGIYDFPAVMNFMLSETGNQKISLVCHSMGCAVYAIALAEQPDLNEKVDVGILLAPALYIGHTYSPFRTLAGVLEMGPYPLKMLNLAMRGRVESGTPLMNRFQSRLCTPSALRCGLCGVSLFFSYGYDGQQMNYTNIPNIMSKFSNTQSVKTLIHLGQNFKSCMFRKYDYGNKDNVLKYGQTQPPSYNLNNLQVPTYIYYANSDNFVPPVDIIDTLNALPLGTVQNFTRVQWELFNHIDFMIAEDADTLVYNNVLTVLSKYTGIEISL